MVDSNVWIFADNENASEHASAVERLQRFLPDGVVTNVIVVSEVFHKLSNGRLGIGAGRAGQRVEVILRHPSVHFMPLKLETVEGAMVLAMDPSLKRPELAEIGFARCAQVIFGSCGS